MFGTLPCPIHCFFHHFGHTSPLLTFLEKTPSGSRRGFDQSMECSGEEDSGDAGRLNTLGSTSWQYPIFRVAERSRDIECAQSGLIDQACLFFRAPRREAEVTGSQCF